jgi:hypothetical protein
MALRPTSRARIKFFEAIYFRSAASGRLSTAMVDPSQPLIGSRATASTVHTDRASVCVGLSDLSCVSRDDRRFNRVVRTPAHFEGNPLARGARNQPSCTELSRQRAMRSGMPSGSPPTKRAA